MNIHENLTVGTILKLNGMYAVIVNLIFLLLLSKHFFFDAQCLCNMSQLSL